jgi:hypothetical protein
VVEFHAEVVVELVVDEQAAALREEQNRVGEEHENFEIERANLEYVSQEERYWIENVAENVYETHDDDEIRHVPHLVLFPAASS